jgi:NADP-dependent 3-hydroxy acid dehydrogenase YdfG
VQRITAVDVAATIEHLATLDPSVAINEMVVRFARQPF